MPARPKSPAQGPERADPIEPETPASPVAAPGRADPSAALAGADLAAFFSSDGPLSHLLEEYELRPSQLSMAESVQRALLSQRHALIEAPTGTGKSLAYLIPALLSGRKVVIATANKSLQSQLFNKDIPFAGKALGREIDAVVVKGRSNYLCTHKWEEELVQQRMFSSVDREHDQIGTIRLWLNETETGDVDELPFMLDSDLRPRIVSFPDDCLQRDCFHYDDACWVNLMRDAAANAQVVVTNHHLLLNALELGMAGERILPPAAVYIVDEAHGLEQTATSVFETMVTDYTVEQLLARSILKQNVEPDVIDELRFHNTLAFSEAAGLGKEQSFVITAELEEMKKLASQLRALSERLAKSKPYGEPPGDGSTEDRSRTESRRALELTLETMNSTVTKLNEVATAKRDGDYVRYAVSAQDRRRVSLELHAAPVNPAGLLRRYLFEPEESEDGPTGRVVVCTSATLATGGTFAHFRARCGITDECEEEVLPAVFDYPRQALLYQPALPAFQYQASEAFYDAAGHELARLLEVSRGRALCLFTNWSGLKRVAERLRGEESQVIWPVRAQGDAPRDTLLAWFKSTPHSVLLATRSFWEGVDIPGDDLSLVVLDKMPFPTPGDPLHSARMRELKAAERDDFAEYMVPLMTLALKQGFGRLIRRSSDSGVVAILDERLSSKSYGRRARTDLPPALFSRDFKEVHRFYQKSFPSQAEFALNVWAWEEEIPVGKESAPAVAWRWQLVRLSDGRRDEQSGVLTPCGELALAELEAVIKALDDLRGRVERGGRSPADFAVELRCSPEAAALLSNDAEPGSPPHPARAALQVWRSVRALELHD